MADKVQKARAILVEKQEFEKDPLPWFRKATPDRQVVVHDGKGNVSLVIGGKVVTDPR